MRDLARAIVVGPYDDSAAGAWDELVERAPMGTLLHSRRFLSYHGDRLMDRSLVVRAGDRLIGLLPAAVAPDDEATVSSHPGATFGGIVHDGRLRGGASLAALTAAAEHFRQLGHRRLRYAPVPSIYHRSPSADDLYALFRLDAVRVKCELACALEVHAPAARSSQRRRGLRRAMRAGVQAVEGPLLLSELWPIVEMNLAARHAARPVHSLAEMELLLRRFPDEMAVVVAYHEGSPVAGVLLFDSACVSHAQYIASTPAGNSVGALDAVFSYCIDRARERSIRFFDFGTSNREQGRILNNGLYEFKASFGGGGVAYEQYELAL